MNMLEMADKPVVCGLVQSVVRLSGGGESVTRQIGLHVARRYH
jgi:hypothetical protein